jgi:hypothetical protein
MSRRLGYWQRKSSSPNLWTCRLIQGIRSSLNSHCAQVPFPDGPSRANGADALSSGVLGTSRKQKRPPMYRPQLSQCPQEETKMGVRARELLVPS